MVNPKNLAALVKKQKKNPLKKALPKDHDEDDDYGSPSTDMSKMHPPKKGKGAHDEKSESSEHSASEESKEDSKEHSHEESAAGDEHGGSHEGSHLPPPEHGGSHPGGDEHGGSHPPEHDEGSDPGEEHEHGGDDGQQGGGKEQWIAMLNDNIDVLQQIVDEMGDLPTENPGNLSPEKKQEIQQEVGRMPKQLQGGFRKFAKNISWEEAQEIASKAGADDPEKLGAWIYWAGKS